MRCKHCDKECKNDNSLRNHQRLCKLNPDRQTTPFCDLAKQKEIADKRKSSGRVNQWSNPGYQLSEHTREKMSRSSIGRQHSKDTKEKISNAVNEKIKNNDWHTSLAKDHHYNYNGVDLHGKWELSYAQWLDANNISWSRCKESFKYFYEGKERRYTPDFYLHDTDEYIEIKGYKTDKDDEKWSQFPQYRNLVVLMKEDLKHLRII